MTRGKDDPEATPPVDSGAAPKAVPLLTSDDIFGDMLDEPPERTPVPTSTPPPARKGPIKVKVSERTMANVTERGVAKATGDAPPEPLSDEAVLLEAFAEAAEASARAAAARSTDRAGEGAEADPDGLLQEVLGEMGPPAATGAVVGVGREVIEPPLEMEVAVARETPPSARAVPSPPTADRPQPEDDAATDAPTDAEAGPGAPDAAQAEALRDLLELRPPHRSVLHPLDALGEVPRPQPSRTRTKFQAAQPNPVGGEDSGLDLAAVAAEALVAPPGQPASGPQPPGPPLPGTPYGPYRLLARVAVGGMAEVFKAKRTGVEGFEKVLAVKRILPHLSENKEFVDMFIDEAKMVAGLSHPNIVQIFDLGKIEKSYYIAMEYVHGRDLRSILRRAREREIRLPLDLSLLIVSRVASALEFAHRKKDERGRPMMIVHRDISPQNILISFEGDVKLTDFGIAKAATKASITDAGALRGKLLYMSPEQAWGRVIDRRSDIFSLGIVLYEMVTDHRPFLGSSETSILEMVRECRVAPPSTLDARVPEKLERAIMKALARDPDERYQDAAEMHRDLERVLHEREPPAPGALAGFLEVLFDEDERSDAPAPRAEAPGETPQGAEPAAGGPASSEDAAAADELELTPPPEPAGSPAKNTMSIQKLLKRFGIR
jgi:hypothetical protein